VQTAARDCPFHPVRTYLQWLRWDGVERVDRWLWAYLGAEDTEYVPGLFPVSKPERAGQSAAVPSVPLSFVRLLCTNGGPRLDLQEQQPGTEEQ
jgi:hypothetical protein